MIGVIVIVGVITFCSPDPICKYLCFSRFTQETPADPVTNV